MSVATIPSPFIHGRPPTWASGYGQDQYGYFAEFSIVTGPHYWQFVTQRMRWIPAGCFTMGSPETEHGHSEDEIQHEVTLTRGFWLADTACMQAVWNAITGANPSEFHSDEVLSANGTKQQRRVTTWVAPSEGALFVPRKCTLSGLPSGLSGRMQQLAATSNHRTCGGLRWHRHAERFNLQPRLSHKSTVMVKLAFLNERVGSARIVPGSPRYETELLPTVVLRPEVAYDLLHFRLNFRL